MVKNEDNKSLKLAVLSVVASVFPWILLLISTQTIDMLSVKFKIQEAVQILIILVPFLLTYVGAALAVLAKKNNICNKMSTARLSVISIIIACINTFVIFLVGSVVVVMLSNQTISVQLCGMAVSLAFVNSIVFILVYSLTKQKHGTNSNKKNLG